MSLTVYATAQDLVDGGWLTTTLPDDVDRLLRSATIAVANACHISPYGATDGGIGTPLTDATCAQVASWIALGVDPAKGGTDLPGPVKASRILTGRVDYDTDAATKLIEQAADGLCQEAEAILFAAGLLWLGDFEIADAAGCWPEATERAFDCTSWPYF